MPGLALVSTLALAARTDDEALAQLVHAYHARVYRYGVRVCRDAFDADDAVQEAFVKLSGRPDVASDRGALAWLFTVVRNACRRLLRPWQRERRALGERVDAEPGHDALARWQLVRDVHAAIAQLEPVHREVLVLRDLEGLSGDETARVLGLELATMKTRLHRARARLRELLQSG
jgi:RNA polymerase sigma-70 factor (ECF subfamily)